MRIERFEQGGRETAGGTEAGTRWNVRKRRDLDLRRLEIERCQRFTDNRMLNLFYPLDMFDARILQVDALRKRPDRRDIDIAIDRAGDQKAFVLVIVRREIRSAPAEAYSQGAASNDHGPDIS